jgi:hypothetical protein
LSGCNVECPMSVSVLVLLTLFMMSKVVLSQLFKLLDTSLFTRFWHLGICLVHLILGSSIIYGFIGGMIHRWGLFANKTFLLEAPSFTSIQLYLLLIVWGLFHFRCLNNIDLSTATIAGFVFFIHDYGLMDMLMFQISDMKLCICCQVVLDSWYWFLYSHHIISGFLSLSGMVIGCYLSILQ